MPWFPRDFMSSTRGWPLIARGAYRELLDAQWDMGDLPIQSEDLRSLCGATEAEWAIAWPKIEPKFPLNCAGRKNQKLEEHRHKAQTLYAKRALGARTANAQRAGVRTHPNPNPNPSPNPSPSQSQESKNKTHGKRAGTLNEFDEIRKEYPRRGGGQRWGDAERGYLAALSSGASHAEILAGVRRYAEFIRGKGSEGTEFVQQAGTFFGRNKGWQESWAPPVMQRELSPIERVMRANGLEKRDERVVSEQSGGAGLGDFFPDVRGQAGAGFRRIGS